MEIEPLDVLMRKIIDKYNQNPEGWNVLTDQNNNLVILDPEKAGYQIKLIQINPYKYTGVGTRITETEDLQQITQGTHSYGFRALTAKNTDQLINLMQYKENIQKQILQKVLDVKPLPLSEIEKRKVDAVISGPYTHINSSNLTMISPGQRELDRRLSLEGNRLFRKQYPIRSSIYG